MTIAVAFDSDAGGRAAMQLGAMLARSADDDLLVCHVEPSAQFELFARFEERYRDVRNQRVEQMVAKAKVQIPDDVEATIVAGRARSAATGLTELCTEHGAGVLVIGSSDSGGIGRITVGTLAERLLHTSSVAVALAPRGFHSKPDSRVERVTVAFDGSDAADDLVVAGAAVAARVNASIRLLVLDVDSPVAYSTSLGSEGDAPVGQEWMDAMDALLAKAVDRVTQLPNVPRRVESVIGRGATWAEAIDDVDWAAGDILAVGSSSVGPVARVFLGSRSAKIIRCSPVPVIVVPASTAAELAETT